MIITQFPEFELVNIFSSFYSKSKWGKTKFFFISCLTLLYISLPGVQIPLFEYSTMRHSSLMDQRILESYFTIIPSQSVVSLSDVSPLLLKSIISMEDGTFFEHHGVNWYELKNSMRINQQKNRKSRGGSTITMQLAKNMFFTTNKSYIRKAKELLITFRLEKEISKEAILSQYVNIIEWGPGLFGIGDAADTYFNKTPDKLSSAEANRLAAVIPAPLKFKPNQNTKYVLRRSAIIRSRYTAVKIEDK